MASSALSLALKRIVDDEAALLLAEFGAGAAFFANGQLIDAQRSGKAAAILFWMAMFEAVALPYAPLWADDPASKGPAPAPAMLLGSAQIASRCAVQDEKLSRRWSGLRRTAIRRMRRSGWQGFRMTLTT